MKRNHSDKMRALTGTVVILILTFLCPDFVFARTRGDFSPSNRFSNRFEVRNSFRGQAGSQGKFVPSVKSRGIDVQPFNTRSRKDFSPNSSNLASRVGTRGRFNKSYNISNRIRKGRFRKPNFNVRTKLHRKLSRR